MSTAEKSERPEQNRDLRCQSGPSTKDSVIFSGGDSSKNYGADQQRLQISDLHFDKFPTPVTFACWKMRFQTEVRTCSQFPTEEMQWIKEVDLRHLLVVFQQEAPDGYTWSGEEIDEKTTYIQARSSMARAMEINGKARQAEGEAKVV